MLTGKSAVLDVGCGTGSLTFEIAMRRKASSIDASDHESDFVEVVNTRRRGLLTRMPQDQSGDENILSTCRILAHRDIDTRLADVG